MRTTQALAIVLLLIGAAACSGSDPAPANAGTTTTTDAGTTTEADAGTTTETDAGTTTETDAGTTTETDAGTPATFDFPENAPGATVSPAFIGACWLRADGTLACTGGDGTGYLPTRFPDTYVDVAYQTCAVKTDGSLKCIVPDNQTDLTPTGTGFRRVSAPQGHACAINANRGVQCWSYPDSGGAAVVAKVPTSGEAVDISGGFGVECAAFKDGSAKCWGDTDYDFGTGDWVRVFAFNGGWACAIKRDGTASCSGSNPLPNNKVRQLAGNFSGICGLRFDGTVACNNQLAPAPTGKFTEIQNGFRSVCGKREGTGVVECWGPPNLVYPSATSFSGVPAQMVIGEGIVLRSNTGTVWTARTDSPLFKQLPSDLASLTSISTSGTTACGLTAAGAVKCWGDYLDQMGDMAAGTTFKVIDTSAFGGCGLDNADKVKCWGSAKDGTPPTDAVAEVCSLTEGGCARHADGSVTCWGNASSSPDSAARFSTIDCSGRIACGVLTSGSISCWGYDQGNDKRVTQAPTSGTFTNVALASDHGCARKTDGTVTCWGNANVVAPSGTFERLWVGTSNACGVRTGGAKFQCWGNVGYESQ